MSIVDEDDFRRHDAKPEDSFAAAQLPKKSEATSIFGGARDNFYGVTDFLRGIGSEGKRLSTSQLLELPGVLLKDLRSLLSFIRIDTHQGDDDTLPRQLAMILDSKLKTSSGVLLLSSHALL